MTTGELTGLDQLLEIVYGAYTGSYEIDKLTDKYPLSIEEGYAIQQKLIQRLVERGGKIAGKKTGLTSKAKQQAMGVHEACYGYLLADTLLEEGQPLSLGGLIHPRAEPELAFVLARPLSGPGITGAQALAATGEIRLALEIIDSRYRNFNFTLPDVVADNCSAGKLLLSKQGFTPARNDLRLMGLTLERNGELMYTGAGAAVLGHPANAVAWLANKLWEVEGRGLEAGEIVLAGAFTPAVEVKPGDTVEATFAGVGTLRLECAG
ncbi:MAG TPA: fumarylacetoacetate hydrolase family protein [Chloroflexia bacterium]|nr:fumarylacetoacetate hydrolase family protein [Chloroflexia bacterium]